MRNLKTYFIAVCCLLLSIAAFAQEFVPNYEESKIPAYALPEILVSKEGQSITSVDQWETIRRPEIVTDFETYVYGRIPKEKFEVQKEVLIEADILGGKAHLKETKLTFSRQGRQISMNILLILPKKIDKVPVFVGLNFYGNQTILDDPAIAITESWTMQNDHFGIVNHKATAASRGVRHYRWPVGQIIARGYGLATIYYGDIDPDKDDFTDGVHALFYQPGQIRPDKDEWGAISAWAWGLSRSMDFLEQEPAVDASGVLVMGHSRLGKAALWAGARDQRFAMVISNDSGCGGAALSRRKYGETVGRITTSFPHWFSDNFDQYANNEDALPVDQHMLVALVAPRPVYVASAKDDLWADPKGEYLSAYRAGEAYRLYNLKGLASETMPEVNHPVGASVGYHMRTGVHDVTDFDWNAWMDFADRHLGRE
ncbi:MAG: acetylxylan esterase [Cyclobacteriaceae bacterium]|nr:acetylxylan esterase [Cyclobacteriaceae bacterium]